MGKFCPPLLEEVIAFIMGVYWVSYLMLRQNIRCDERKNHMHYRRDVACFHQYKTCGYVELSEI